jgi:hypothetical protein
MATEHEHRRQADHNQAFLDSIDAARFPDWTTTAAFYKAVHLVQALFAASGHQCRSHSSRNKLLRLKFATVWKQYHPLYSFSRLARYWCFRVKPEHVRHVIRRLGRIERAIKAERAKLQRRGKP